MFLHVGQSVVLSDRDIIGIFDLDNVSYSPITRSFLERAEREGRVINVTEELPKSVVLCKKGQGESVVYLSQLSSATLKGRWENPGVE